LKYEGEFLMMKKNGMVKEYNDDGELIFEGKYINGERNGKGKEYYKNVLIFEGE
jgi:antitoxin component YwqK of YwqJK toxin-antitoxin module